MNLNTTIRKGNLKLLKKRIDEGHDINSSLVVACEYGKFEIVKYLVELGQTFITSSSYQERHSKVILK